MASVVDKTLNSIMRPKSLEKIILLDRIRKSIGDGVLSNHFLLESPSPGTGKTSLSKILAQGRPTLYINASEEGRIEFLRDQLTEFCSTRSMSMPDADFKVVILDELDGSSDTFFKALRPVIEKYENSVRFIATCNYINKLPDPIISRFKHIKFYPQNEEEEQELFELYIKKLTLLSKKLGIKWESEEVLKQFIKKYFPDLRTIFNNLQDLNVSEVELVTLEDIKRTSVTHAELFNLLVTNSDPIKNYQVLMTYSNKVSDIFLSLGQEFPIWLEENHNNKMLKLGQILIYIADWEFKSRSSIDPILHLIACFFQIQQTLNS